MLKSLPKHETKQRFFWLHDNNINFNFEIILLPLFLPKLQLISFQVKASFYMLLMNTFMYVNAYIFLNITPSVYRMLSELTIWYWITNLYALPWGQLFLLLSAFPSYLQFFKTGIFQERWTPAEPLLGFVQFCRRRKVRPDWNVSSQKFEGLGEEQLYQDMGLDIR